ncbi:MAG: transporter substrate-binding domain-containing protein [Deltaproteobacteria bacterium]|nr:transporter substrate-binding domain-containing protein [Deltaproteobacteria bacterium]
MRPWPCLSLLLLCAAVLPAPAADTAGAPVEPAAPPLVIGVFESPPLVIRLPDGSWSGLAVDLWTRIAGDLGLRFQFREVGGDDVGEALHDKALDAALGAIPVTPEGETQHDYSQPYLVTGLGFAQRTNEPLHWDALRRTLFDPRLLTVIGVILVGVLVVGVAIALVERRHNATDFGGPLRTSVSTGVWWAAVTMTTVGYGDATPKTTPGRALALLWMFVGVVAVAILTATVTSILTLSHLRGAVEHPADLLRLRLGAVPGGAGDDYLTDRHTPFVRYDDYGSGLQALSRNEIDAFVANIPALRYLTLLNWHGQLDVSPIVLEPVLFAIALPDDSPLREALDSALVRVTHSDSWVETERHYLGREHR